VQTRWLVDALLQGHQRDVYAFDTQRRANRFDIGQYFTVDHLPLAKLRERSEPHTLLKVAIHLAPLAQSNGL
jgi:hypothetical protein